MPLGVLYDGMSSPKDLLSFIKEAEKSGLDSLWIAEHVTYHEALVIASFILSQTKGIKVFAGPISPYTVHPIMISMAAVSLSKIGNGRFGLVLGTGDYSALRNIGVQGTSPLPVIKDAVQIIRALCNGETVDKSGIWSMKNIRLSIPIETQIPIYLTAIGTKMLSLAKQISDGVVLSAAISPKFVQYSLNSIAKSLQRKTSSKNIGYILASVNSDYHKALEEVKPKLAFMLRGSYLKHDWEINGLCIDGDAIENALDKHKDLKSACDLISERDVITLTAAGTPDMFKYKLREYIDAGVDYPVILPVGNIQKKLEIVRFATNVCGK